MIRNIIVALVAFVILSLFVLWILNGGIGRMIATVKNFSFTSGNGGEFTLPWQPEGLIPRIEPDVFLSESDSSSPAGTPEAELARLQEEFSSIESGVRDLATVGIPSPHFGKVLIRETFSNPRGQRSEREYVTIEAAYANSAPISLSGWSLQSAVTGISVPIPTAASLFWMGAVNTLSPVLIDPGHTAVVATGASPVGVSFRENMCTGYLSQFQSFEPALHLRCPSPSEEMSLTTQHLQQYGPECIDAAYNIPTCEFPQQLPASISTACRAFLQTTLSYNGCLSRHASDVNFPEDTWRLYVGSAMELWRNNHDAIRLLDADGKVVDVYVY